jgi:hypothetical protein
MQPSHHTLFLVSLKGLQKNLLVGGLHLIKETPFQTMISYAGNTFSSAANCCQMCSNCHPAWGMAFCFHTWQSQCLHMQAQRLVAERAFAESV